MKNVVLVSVFAVNLFGAAPSFAQTSTTDPSPAFGYPSPTAPGYPKPPTTGTEGTYAPDFKGYTDPNTSPTTSGQTSERRAPDAVGR